MTDEFRKQYLVRRSPEYKHFKTMVDNNYNVYKNYIDIIKCIHTRNFYSSTYMNSSIYKKES